MAKLKQTKKPGKFDPFKSKEKKPGSNLFGSLELPQDFEAGVEADEKRRRELRDRRK